MKLQCGGRFLGMTRPSRSSVVSSSDVVAGIAAGTERAAVDAAGLGRTQTGQRRGGGQGKTQAPFGFTACSFSEGRALEAQVDAIRTLQHELIAVQTDAESLGSEQVFRAPVIHGLWAALQGWLGKVQRQ